MVKQLPTISILIQSPPYELHYPDNQKYSSQPEPKSTYCKLFSELHCNVNNVVTNISDVNYTKHIEYLKLSKHWLQFTFYFTNNWTSR